MKKLREAFALRQLVSWLTILIAFLAVGGYPQRWGVSTERIILALLVVQRDFDVRTRLPRGDVLIHCLATLALSLAPQLTRVWGVAEVSLYY